jgi:hypothetical protein
LVLVSMVVSPVVGATLKAQFNAVNLRFVVFS